MKTMTVLQTINSQYSPDPESKEHMWMFVVEKVTNSTVPAIHDRLQKEELDVYCDSELWNVTIK